MGFWWALLKLYPRLTEQKGWWLFSLVWIFSIKPIHNSFQCYNVQLLFAAVFVIAEYLCRRSSPGARFWGGFLVMPLAAMKVFPGLVALYYLCFRDRSVKRGVVVGGLVSALIPLVYYGPTMGVHITREFFVHLPEYQKYYPLEKDVLALSLGSFVSRWAPLVISQTAANQVSVVLMSLVLAGAFLCFSESEVMRRKTLAMVGPL